MAPDELAHELLLSAHELDAIALELRGRRAYPAQRLALVDEATDLVAESLDRGHLHDVHAA
jgi:hypothetical protein